MYRLEFLVYPVHSRTPAQPPGGDESLSTQHFNQRSERSAIQNVLLVVAFTSAHNAPATHSRGCLLGSMGWRGPQLWEIWWARVNTTLVPETPYPSEIQTHIILTSYEHTLSSFHCTESMSYVITISVWYISLHLILDVKWIKLMP